MKLSWRSIVSHVPCHVDNSCLHVRLLTSSIGDACTSDPEANSELANSAVMNRILEVLMVDNGIGKVEAKVVKWTFANEERVAFYEYGLPDLNGSYFEEFVYENCDPHSSRRTQLDR